MVIWLLAHPLLAVWSVSLRILSNSLSNVLQKRLTAERQHPLVINLVTYLLLSLPALCLVQREDLDDIGWPFIGYTLLTGLTGALGNGYLVRALQSGDLSVLGPVNAWKSVIGMVTAFLLMGAVPGWGGMAGIVLIICGSYVVLGAGGGQVGWAVFRQAAIRHRIYALLLTGMQAVFDKQVIRHSNLRLAFASWAIGGAFFAALLVCSRRIRIIPELQRIAPRVAGKYLLLALLIGLMVASTNLTFSLMPVGAALSLFQLSILLSVILGVRLFNETGLWRKLLGATIMIAGSLLIIRSP